MDKPCFKCAIYNKDQDNCEALAKLRSARPTDSDSKSMSLDELLVRRPCQFSHYILKIARHFIHKRGLDSQIDPGDILSNVVVALIKANLENIEPVYKDFRPYITAMIGNEVDHVYKQRYGKYRCGACVFFLQTNNGLPSRCSHPELKPVLGQPYIQVNDSTNPKTVIHGEGSGCWCYSPIQFVTLNDIDRLTVPDENEVENSLIYMEAIGPRQRRQANLLRKMLEGYKITEIASVTGKHRTTIPKELNGTTEREKDDSGKEVSFHQAGACEVFKAIHTGAIFKLKQEEKHLWSVVDRRDFSPDTVQPSFNKIGSEFGISKTKAIKHYVDGWNWIEAHITKGGGSMSGGGNNQEHKPEQSWPARRIARTSEMHHPDFHALLAYAEDTLDRETRKRIAGHILICERCSAEFERVEMEILPVMEHPINLVEHLRQMPTRLVGRILKASDTAGSTANARGSGAVIGLINRLHLSASLAYGLAITIVALLLVFIWQQVRYSQLRDQAASLTAAIDTLKQQNESLLQENAEMEDREEKRTAADKQKEQLLAGQRELIAQLQNKDRRLPAQPTSRLRVQVPFQDESEVVTVGIKLVGGAKDELARILNNMGGTYNLQSNNTPSNAIIELSPALSQSMSELYAEAVKPAESVIKARVSIDNDETQGASRGTGSAEDPAPVPLSPVRTAVRSTRPTLRWEPVPGVKEYKVRVTNLNDSLVVPIISVGTETQLTIPEDNKLQQGQVYFWEVEAVMEGESNLSPRISSAGFWVLDEKTLLEVQAAERKYKPSALLRAVVYTKYGLDEEARAEMNRLPDREQTNPFAKKMFDNLRRQLRKE